MQLCRDALLAAARRSRIGPSTVIRSTIQPPYDLCHQVYPGIFDQEAPGDSTQERGARRVFRFLLNGSEQLLQDVAWLICEHGDLLTDLNWFPMRLAPFNTPEFAEWVELSVLPEYLLAKASPFPSCVVLLVIGHATSASSLVSRPVAGFAAAIIGIIGNATDHHPRGRQASAT